MSVRYLLNVTNRVYWNIYQMKTYGIYYRYYDDGVGDVMY